MLDIHPASQIQTSKHSKHVLELTKLRVNKSLVGARPMPVTEWAQQGR